MKKCTKCGIAKPFDSFAISKHSKSGLSSECKLCKNKYYADNKERLLTKQKEYYQATRERQVEYRRKYYQENKEKCLESIKQYNDKNPTKKREDYLIRNYGIDLAGYDELLKQQDNLCAVCRISFDYNLVVDHNHNTGEVRGLLCNPCNQALGILKDNPTVVLNAYQYLIEKGHYGQEAA